MIKCWSSNPRDRPSCEEIWHFIKDLGVRDTRPPIPPHRGGDATVWEDIRAAWDSKIDYQRVYNVLTQVSRRFLKITVLRTGGGAKLLVLVL